MPIKFTAFVATALLAFNAAAAAPTASLNRGWVEYTGTGPIGNNNVNDDAKAYWMFESTGTWNGQAVNSWFVFWDPSASLGVRGTIRFDNTILFVHDEKSELKDTMSFGKPGVKYDYSRSAVGLEDADRNHTSFVGDTLSIRWNASNPGDHIRVMTAVPEPSTYALFGAGLLALGYMARRRRQR